MSHLSITAIAANLDEYEGKEVELKGWLYNKRGSKKLQFLQVRDGTATLQCVVGKKDVDEDTFNCAKQLTQETSSSSTGPCE